MSESCANPLESGTRASDLQQAVEVGFCILIPLRLERVLQTFSKL